MDVRQKDTSGEIKRLQRCLNDLVSILALPAMWSGSQPSQIVHTLLDALLGMLCLDLVYGRLQDPAGGAPIEVLKIAPSAKCMLPDEIHKTLNQWFGDDPQKWPSRLRASIGDEDISIVSQRCGLHGEIGVIVAGSGRADFPGQTETLLLSVAANEAVIGLHEARLLLEQKRVASELDRRVVQRTAELVAINDELRKEIDDRKRAEEELRRSEAFLAEGQRLSLSGSFLWRLDTDQITFSEQLYRTFEFDRDAPVTLERIGSRVHSQDIPLLTDKIEAARSGNSVLNYEIRLRMPNGSVKYLRTIAHGTRDRDGRPEIIGAVQDVTERRLAEEALSQARSDLAHVTRVTSLGVLTASTAHEVNQPLSGIITNAGTCLRMLAAEPPNVEGARETAKRTIRDGIRASELIMRLRALFSKKESTTEPVDLNEATQEVIALSLSELQRNRVILRPEFADDLPAVTGERVQLQQVILNLLKNASDAMSAVNDRPRQLQIRTERGTDDQVRLIVQDAGVGLDPQAMDRLFQAFYTTKNNGMGIGLSVSRSIIERHHGRLWAEPNDGPGATFSFSIPPWQEGASDAG